MTMSKKITVIMIILVVVLLTGCNSSTGLTKEELNTKINEYGFFQMPESTKDTSSTNKVTDADITITYDMEYEDFQAYAEQLYEYYFTLEDIKVIGYLDRMESVGFFTNVFITISNYLPLESGDNIENNDIKYTFAFSTLDQQDNSSLDERKIIILSYSPAYSVSGNNVTITLDKSTLTSVYINKTN